MLSRSNKRRANMPTASANFSTYKLWYYSSHTLDAYYEALIYCYSGTTMVGRIEFYKEPTPEVSLKSTISGTMPIVRYRLSRFNDVMGILIHEKPLNLFVNSDNGIGSVSTADFEPTGEEEL
jgi:hypothetical protein